MMKFYCAGPDISTSGSISGVGKLSILGLFREFFKPLNAALLFEFGLLLSEGTRRTSLFPKIRGACGVGGETGTSKYCLHRKIIKKLDLKKK